MPISVKGNGSAVIQLHYTITKSWSLSHSGGAVKQEIANAKCVREDPLQQDAGLNPKATVAKEKRNMWVEESVMKIQQLKKITKQIKQQIILL